MGRREGLRLVVPEIKYAAIKSKHELTADRRRLMSIAHDLSSDIAAAVLSRGKRNPEKLNDLKETVIRVHSVLEELDHETRPLFDSRKSRYTYKRSFEQRAD